MGQKTRQTRYQKSDQVWLGLARSLSTNVAKYWASSSKKTNRQKHRKESDQGTCQKSSQVEPKILTGT